MNKYNYYQWVIVSKDGRREVFYGNYLALFDKIKLENKTPAALIRKPLLTQNKNKH